jgi:hypothetical protein
MMTWFVKALRLLWPISFFGSIALLIYVFFYTRWDLLIYDRPWLLVAFLALPILARVGKFVYRKVNSI